MLLEAVAKAKVRFQKATKALEAIRDSEKFSELEFAWTDYLHAHNSIFTILEQGAKNNPQSRQWFGAKKKFRKADSLLNYLHQARNADEHGISSVIERRLSGGITFGEQPAGAGRKITKVTFKPAGGKEVVLEQDDGGISSVTVLRPVFLLLKVRNTRFGGEWEPPSAHLGEPLRSPRPIQVAEIGLQYVANLISEAEKMIQ